MAKRHLIRNPVTPEKLDAFIDALADAETVAGAAKIAKLSKTRAHEIKLADPAFAKRWEAAYDTGTEKLEAEAIRRGTMGVRKPVYQGGKLVGYVQDYSDTLLIFMLKARRPEVYRERFEHSGPGGGPIQVQRIERVIVDSASDHPKDSDP